MKVGVKHFLLHLAIGFLAGAVAGHELGAAAAIGGVFHMEGEDRYQGQTNRRTAQGVVERGAGAVVGVGIGALLRHVIFG